MSEEQPVSSEDGTKPWSGDGREQLADAVRRLIAATVTSVASPELLTETAQHANRLADALERHVPAPGPEPVARFADPVLPLDGAAMLAAAMPFDVIIGTCNPLALPLTIEFEPPKAIGRAEFTAPYEGAPGLVHGAVLAAAFDIILTAANVIAGGPGPTVSLSIRYLKPTRLDVPSVFEGWVTELDERRTHSEGRLIQGDVVTVEAVGEFVNMERSRVVGLHRREPRGADSNGSGGEAAP